MDDKQAVRERVWRAMQQAKVARFPGARGRIPNFTGAERAAELLAGTDAWARAHTLKCNPDSPQLPVRARALADGKIVYMAVPRLRDEKPFVALDPAHLDVAPRKAASISGSAAVGIPVALDDLTRIDLIVCGTVAVNRDGVRIGKGGGFSDLEFALVAEHGAVDDDTVIATTVHPLQVLDEELPETAHDFGVDLIVTPEEVIHTERRRRPSGVLWEDLDDAKIAEIPVLAARREMRS